MLNIKLNDKPIKLMDLLNKLNKKIDWISVRLIINFDNEDKFDAFVGCFVMDENNNIIPFDNDNYSKDMEIWQWQEYRNMEDNIENGLIIWVYDF